MKIKTFLIAAFALIVLASSANFAQQQKPKKPRPSLKAGVSQRIGIDTDIKIDYSRPGVKGRKIWGALVPYGMAPADKESNNNPYPWRGGANENTTIEFSKDILVEGNKLPAGKYGLHFIPSETTWIIIFSKNSTSWGRFQYKQSEDALRVTVTPVKAPFEEWLAYGFDDLNTNSATAYLHWEQLKVPFKIAVAETP